MARIVLVHGAFAGAWCWEPVLPGLRAAGHTVRGDRPARRRRGHDAGGRGDPRCVRAADLRSARRRAGRRCSSDRAWAGWRSPRRPPAAPSSVAALVYVAAFVPADGQSLVDLVTAYPEAAGDQVQANLVVEGDPPVATLPPRRRPHALYNCAPHEQARVGAWRDSAPSRSPRSRSRSRSADAERRRSRRCRGRTSLPPGPRDPAGDAAPDVHRRGLRPGDRDRHRPLAVAVSAPTSWWRRWIRHRCGPRRYAPRHAARARDRQERLRAMAGPSPGRRR